MVYSPQALFIHELHYQARDNKSQLVEKSPSDVFNRIGNAYLKHGVPKKIIKSFKELSADQIAVLSSPIYYNLGITENPILAACFVSDLKDSMVDIGKTWATCLLIFKAGAGVGIPIWHLRPEGASLGDGGLEIAGPSGSSGPNSFMTAYHNAGDIVMAAGKRRAAILCSMMCWHPDVEKFISIKAPGPNRDKYTNMNLSVLCTDEFMRKVREKAEWNLAWEDKIWSTTRADLLLKKMAHHAWQTGDPGILFYDRINMDNFAPQLGPMDTTNPCGEQPQNPNTSCNLVANNLYAMFKKYEIRKEAHRKEAIRKRVNESVKVLMPLANANVDLSHYPTPEFTENSRYMRNTGVGLLGFAEGLAHLGIPYASEKGRDIAMAVMEEITLAAYEWSLEESKKSGPAPCFEDIQGQDAFQKIMNRYLEHAKEQNKRTAGQIGHVERWEAIIKEAEKGHYPRNASVSTIAPNGNTGVAFDAWTGGAEPIYALHYERSIRERELNQTKKIVLTDPEFLAALKERGINLPIETIVEAKGRAGGLPIPEDLKEIFATSHEIHWKDRVNMQAAFQLFCTSGISGTVNCPEETTEEDVMQIYQYAHEKGCKGITIFRDNCMVRGILDAAGRRQELPKYKRPPILHGMTLKAKLYGEAGHRNAYITINSDSYGRPVEAFIQVGNSGSTENAANQATGRMISGGLQMGVPVENVIKSHLGIRSAENGRVMLDNTDKKPVAVSSMQDLIAQFLRRQFVDKVEITLEDGGMECPMCKHLTLIDRGDGCPECSHCDFKSCL